MKLIAVVGSASGSGKTGVACAILRAIPGLGAVKISPRVGTLRVERGPGLPGKDTARYTESGAVAVARLVAPRENVLNAWEQVRREFEPLRGVVVEGAGALELPGRRFTIFVVAPATLGERPERDARLAAAADCVVVVRSQGGSGGDEHPFVTRRRGRVAVVEVSPEAADWTHPVLVATVRDFLSEKEEVEASIPLAPPCEKGEKSTGSLSPTGEPPGSEDHPGTPSPKGDAGGLIIPPRDTDKE